MPSLDFTHSHRSKFPALANKTYLNFGGQGPLPESALTAMAQTALQLQVDGPFSVKVNRWLTQTLQSTRQAIATELGAEPEAIALTDSVSGGCNIALWGLDWQAGDHLLMSDCEHPSVIATVKEIQRRFGVEVSLCPIQSTLNDGDPVAVIAEHLRSNTKLVAISHILWNTGQVLPVAEIVKACHQYPAEQPIRVLVDAAQSAGVLPLNLRELNADFYAFTGHKWLCGPAGLGGLYVRPAVMENLHPTYIGWRGIDVDAMGNPTGWKPDARRYEVATSDFVLGTGLQEAIATHQQWGTATERYQQICELSKALWQQLNQVSGVQCLRAAPPEAGLVSFQVPGRSHGQIVEELERREILVRTIADPNCIRACVHYFSTLQEIDHLVNTLKSLL